MRNTLLNLYVKFQGLKNGEEGQDLVEYALLCPDRTGLHHGRQQRGNGH